MAWYQLSHSEDRLLFPENAGEHLNIDKDQTPKTEHYNILSYKVAKGQKGVIVTVV